MSRKLWGGQDRRQANAPASQISLPPDTSAKQWEMVEQVRAGIADVARSREKVRQHMALLAQNNVKLNEQAELARNAGREDLAREALIRRQELENQISVLTIQYERLRDDEQKLNVALQRLEAKVTAYQQQRAAIVAWRESRPGQPYPKDLLSAEPSIAPSHDAPMGERNSRVIPQDVKIAVAARDHGRCRQCGSTDDLHFDHVIPWSKGGANTVNNIQLLCGRCNRRKGADDIPAVL